MAHHNHHHQHRHNANIVHLVERAAVPVAEPVAAVGTMGHNIDIAIPNRVIEARADSTQSASPTSSCGAKECSYGTSYTLPIILGVA